MGHDFAPFLQAADEARDPLLDAWVADLPADRRAWLDTFGGLSASLWRDLADASEEDPPRLAGKGPYDDDVQAVVLPSSTWEALSGVHGSGIWREDLEERARYAAVYLLNQNGEAGVACSVACTDGLMRVLRSVETEGPAQEILDALHAADSDAWIHGAQFVTEVQGGSDAATNAVRAEDLGDGTYGIHGQKWFCSNLTAEWWLVTARHAGHAPAPDEARGGHVASGIGLFLVPRDQDGYAIERLKEKLGTRALPTAEILFHGARGWPVGPLDAGLRTMVEHVLVTSRIHNVLAAAAFLRRASREAHAYASFRHAFGRRLDEMPLIADTLERLAQAADRAEAGAFCLVDLWVHARSPQASDEERAFSRLMVSIAKAVATRRLPGLVHEAMMVLGGNGIEERFTVLPRLYRDAAILETWEGPYTLLLGQAWRDAQRLGVDADVLRVGLGEQADVLAEGMHVLLESEPGPAWRDWCHDAMDAFEAEALRLLAGAVRGRASG